MIHVSVCNAGKSYISHAYVSIWHMSHVDFKENQK